uniref:Uncharacterized protein n=1 Tax=Knipowitschia caucasica TaxID=637954 RepID=A0AAV2M4I2_KNICA
MTEVVEGGEGYKGGQGVGGYGRVLRGGGWEEAIEGVGGGGGGVEGGLSGVWWWGGWIEGIRGGGCWVGGGWGVGGGGEGRT